MRIIELIMLIIFYKTDKLINLYFTIVSVCLTTFLIYVYIIYVDCKKTDKLIILCLTKK